MRTHSSWWIKKVENVQPDFIELSKTVDLERPQFKGIRKLYGSTDEKTRDLIIKWHKVSLLDFFEIPEQLSDDEIMATVLSLMWSKTYLEQQDTDSDHSINKDKIIHNGIELTSPDIEKINNVINKAIDTYQTEFLFDIPEKFFVNMPMQNGKVCFTHSGEILQFMKNKFFDESCTEAEKRFFSRISCSLKKISYAWIDYGNNKTTLDAEIATFQKFVRTWFSNWFEEKEASQSNISQLSHPDYLSSREFVLAKEALKQADIDYPDDITFKISDRPKKELSILLKLITDPVYNSAEELADIWWLRCMVTSTDDKKAANALFFYILKKYIKLAFENKPKLKQLYPTWDQPEKEYNFWYNDEQINQIASWKAGIWLTIKDKNILDRELWDSKYLRKNQLSIWDALLQKFGIRDVFIEKLIENRQTNYINEKINKEKQNTLEKKEIKIEHLKDFIIDKYETIWSKIPEEQRLDLLDSMLNYTNRWHTENEQKMDANGKRKTESIQQGIAMRRKIIDEILLKTITAWWLDQWKKEEKGEREEKIKKNPGETIKEIESHVHKSKSHKWADLKCSGEIRASLWEKCSMETQVVLEKDIKDMDPLTNDNIFQLSKIIHAIVRLEWSIKVSHISKLIKDKLIPKCQTTESWVELIKQITEASHIEPIWGSFTEKVLSYYCSKLWLLSFADYKKDLLYGLSENRWEQEYGSPDYARPMKKWDMRPRTVKMK